MRENKKIPVKNVTPSGDRTRAYKLSLNVHSTDILV